MNQTNQPPLLIEHIGASRMGRRLFSLRNFWIFSILLSLLFALSFALLTQIPIQATILVPAEACMEMRQALSEAGTPATQDHVVWMNTAHFRSVPGLGIEVWLVQSSLLTDAKNNGYYCCIEYTPLIDSFRWSKSVGDSRMVGLQ
ncbi:MAG: hypothetical protein AAF394_08680 [Planctomycetota bacterium]